MEKEPPRTPFICLTARRKRAPEREWITISHTFPVTSQYTIPMWRAVLIVLLLHVVAASGIFWLHWLKTHSTEGPVAPPKEMQAEPSPEPVRPTTEEPLLVMRHDKEKHRAQIARALPRLRSILTHQQDHERCK